MSTPERSAQERVTTGNVKGDAAGGGPYLYLVLHGEFAIIDVKGATSISVLAPAMDEHAYMAGPWLGERHVPQGTTLVLRNVRGAEPAEAPTFHNAMLITFNGVVGNADCAWMELRIPRPIAVLPYELRKIPQGAITVYGPSGASMSAPPPEAPIVPVLQYKLSGSPPLLHDIEGMMGTEWGAGSPYKDGSYSLHVFAEIDSPFLDPEHAARAFRSAARLMGVDASIVPEFPPLGKGGPNPHGPPLIGVETSLRLYQRVTVFAGLGATQRQGTPEPPMNLDVASTVDEASCGPISGLSGY